MTDTLARQRQIVGAAADWATHDLILGDGELAIVREADGAVRAKVGNGEATFSAAPYLTTSASPLRYIGTADPTAPPPDAAPGDVYSAEPGGTVDASWGPPLAGAVVEAGDLLIMGDDGAWHTQAGGIDPATLVSKAELGGADGGEMVGHTDHDTLATTAPLQGIIRRQPLDPLLYGVLADGATDTEPAWRDRVAPALIGFMREVVLPTGVTVIRDQIDLGELVILQGNGAGVSILHVQNPAGMADLHGLLLRSGSRVRGLTLRVDRAGQNSCAGYSWAPGTEDVAFADVAFEGVGRVNEWAGIMGGASGADASNFRWSGCTATNLDFGLVPIKANEHTSTQTNFHWLNCTADDCTDGFNINSPKGVFRDWSILQCFAKNSTQFAFGFAGSGCHSGRIDIAGRDNPFELVHIEDGANRIEGRISGERNNLQRGIAPGPNDNINGSVQIIGGANHLILDLSLDCTVDVGGSPNGVVILAGGPRVSDGLTVNPSNITLSGQINLKNDGSTLPAGNGGCIGVAAFDIPSIHFERLALVNAVPSSKSQRALYLPGCSWTGEIEVFNPGVILETNNTTPGGFNSIRYSGDTVGMVFQKGLFVSRTGSDLFSEIDTTLPFTVGPAYPWQKIMPALYNLRGEFSFAYKGAAANMTYQGLLLIQNGVLLPTELYAGDPVGSTIGLPGAVIVRGAEVDPLATVTTGNISTGSPIIAGIASLANVEVGCPVSGGGIPAGSRVISIEDAATVKISKLCTATSGGVALTFTPPNLSTMLFQINAGWIEARLYRFELEAGAARFKLTGATAFPLAA